MPDGGDVDVVMTTTPPTSHDQSDHVIPRSAFWPSKYHFLAELSLEYTGITSIPAGALSDNPDLYYLSLRGNPIQTIEMGAFSHLDKLRTLDLRESSTPSNADIRAALQQIPALETVYADSFAFCCMLNLAPAGDLDATGCFAPVDQFSSCDDLLKDNTLRVFMWILGLSALAGNIFVIGLRVFQKKMVVSTRIQSRLITNLAVSDLLMGVYMLIIAGADQHYSGDYAIHADRWRNSVQCSIAGFLSAFSSEVSVFLIMLISLDRILCVAFSHHRDIQLSGKSAMVWLVVAWTAAFVITLVPALPVDYFHQFYGRSSVCLGLPLTTDRPPGWEYSLSIFLGLNLVCFIVTAFCYIGIFVVVHRSAARVSKGKESGRHVRNGMTMQVKLATRMAIIVGTDFICWMPIIIMALLSATGAVEIPADVYAWAAVFILPLNSSLNPYLYTLSAVWQRHKAKNRSKRLESESMKDTRLTSAAVTTPVSRKDLVSKHDKELSSQCLLTPYSALSLTLPVVPLAKYVQDRGEPPSIVDTSLITHDVRKAVSFLRSKSLTGVLVTEDRIAVQLNSSGEIVHAFLVYSDPAIMHTVCGNGTAKNKEHMAFMERILDNLKLEEQYR